VIKNEFKTFEFGQKAELRKHNSSSYFKWYWYSLWCFRFKKGL